MVPRLGNRQRVSGDEILQQVHILSRIVKVRRHFTLHKHKSSAETISAYGVNRRSVPASKAAFRET